LTAAATRCGRLVKATARGAVPRSAIVSASSPVAVTKLASAVTSKSQLAVALFLAAAALASAAGGAVPPSQIAAPMPMPTPRATAATSAAMRSAKRRGGIAAPAAVIQGRDRRDAYENSGSQVESSGVEELQLEEARPERVAGARVAGAAARSPHDICLSHDHGLGQRPVTSSGTTGAFLDRATDRRGRAPPPPAGGMASPFPVAPVPSAGTAPKQHASWSP
jgi:hypothetical protein